MKSKLSENIDLIGGGTPKTSVPEYWGGDIPWLSVKDFSDDSRYVYSTEKKITEAGLANSSTKLLNVDDIIISARGTVGELAMIPFPMAFNQSCYGIRGKKGKVIQTYLYYLLKDSIRLLKRQTHGSVFDTITRDTFANIYVDFPSLAEQQMIADTLSALDARIAENRKINHHLVQMAQAIFTESCSEGETAVLSDILTVCYGKDHKRLGDGVIPCYGSGGIMRYVDKPLYTGESVLIPRKGSLNNVMYVNEAFWTVDTMFYTQMTHPNVAKFAYFIMRAIDLAGMNVGSAVPSMTTTVLNSLEIVLPSDDTLANFEENVTPMFLKMQANNEESARLAELRDTLLPRLMSGELSVSDLSSK